MITRSHKASILVLVLSVLTAGGAFAASTPIQAAGSDGLTGIFVPQVQAPGFEARSALDAVLYHYDVVDLPLAAVARQVRARGELGLVLQGRLFEFVLEPNELLASDFAAVLMTEAGAVEVPFRGVATYRGTVLGEPDSTVRLTADRGILTGFVRTGDDWIFIDPLRDYAAAAPMNALVVYREADIRPEAGGLCGVSHASSTGPDPDPGGGPGLSLGLDPGPGFAARNHNTLRPLRVATDADGEYYQRYGNPGTFNRIQGILNNVSGIYQNQINLSIVIAYMQAWGNPNTDPYSSNNAVTNLNQFRNWWNANRGGVSRAAAHLWSGKTFSGGTIGVAWVGVICNAPSYSYGLSQDLSNSGQRTRLTAHEIGHNLSAQHDNQIGCPVSCNGSGPIMCSSLQANGPNSFSSCSVNAINNHTHSNNSCLN